MSTVSAVPDGTPQTLPARIAAGDRTAEAEFVQRYERGVRILVRRHTRPGEPAVDDLVQDVLHETLLKLRAGALDDPDALPGYLRATVAGKTTSEYRQRARRGTAEPVAVLESLPDPSTPDPAVALARADVVAAVRVAIRTLPVARDRRVLWLLHIDGRSHEEVAGLLGIEQAHVRRVAFRALQRCADQLGRRFPALEPFGDSDET